MAAVTQRFAPAPAGATTTVRPPSARPERSAAGPHRRKGDAFWAAMVADTRHAAASPPKSSQKAGPGGQRGNASVASAAGSHLETPALRPSHSRTRSQGYDVHVAAESDCTESATAT